MMITWEQVFGDLIRYFTVGWVNDWSINYTGMVLVSWSDRGIINWQDVWGTYLCGEYRFRRTLGLFHLHIRNPCLLFRLE